MPLLRTVLVLYLMGFVSEFKVCSFSRQKRSLLTAEVEFDMATASFDDQYSGCEDEMDKKAGELQANESANNNIYAEVWGNAVARWEQIKSSDSFPKSLKPDYAIAVVAYTQSKDSLYMNFNGDVRKAGENENHYLQKFHFKAFHFFLTRALQVLQPNSHCFTTYRGVKDIHFSTERSKKVRFGHFASSSLDINVAKGYGEDTFFTITSCHGVSIQRFSFNPREKEVLIPPYEVFEVAEITTKTDGIKIKLISVEKFSNYNCVYAKGAGISNLYANIWMPFLLWGFFLIIGALRV